MKKTLKKIRKVPHNSFLLFRYFNYSLSFGFQLFYQYSLCIFQGFFLNLQFLKNFLFKENLGNLGGVNRFYILVSFLNYIELGKFKPFPL